MQERRPNLSLLSTASMKGRLGNALPVPHDKSRLSTLHTAAA